MEDLKILKNLTLLYAEDDKEIRETTKSVFEIFFKKVIFVENGEKAIEVFNNRVIDMIVLDIKMPKVDGIEVAKEIRKVDLNIPIFITTSFVQTNVLLEAVKLNLIDYLIKPIEFSTLKETLIQTVNRMKREEISYKEIDKDIIYNQLSKFIIKNGIEIKLTKREIYLIEFLLKYRGQLVSKEFLEENIFGIDVKESSLRDLVYSLRKKIASDKIVNIKDSGYLLRKL